MSTPIVPHDDWDEITLEHSEPASIIDDDDWHEVRYPSNDYVRICANIDNPACPSASSDDEGNEVEVLKETDDDLIQDKIAMEIPSPIETDDDLIEDKLAVEIPPIFRCVGGDLREERRRKRVAIQKQEPSAGFAYRIEPNEQPRGCPIIQDPTPHISWPDLPFKRRTMPRTIPVNEPSSNELPASRLAALKLHAGPSPDRATHVAQHPSAKSSMEPELERLMCVSGRTDQNLWGPYGRPPPSAPLWPSSSIWSSTSIGPPADDSQRQNWNFHHPSYPFQPLVPEKPTVQDPQDNQVNEA